MNLQTISLRHRPSRRARELRSRASILFQTLACLTLSGVFGLVTPARAEEGGEDFSDDEEPPTETPSHAYGAPIVAFGSQTFEQLGFGVLGGRSVPRLGEGPQLYYGGRFMYFLGSEFSPLLTSRVQSLFIAVEGGMDFLVPLGSESQLTLRPSVVLGYAFAWITDFPATGSYGLLSPGASAIYGFGPAFVLAEVRLPIHTFGSLSDVDNSTFSIQAAAAVGLRL